MPKTESDVKTRSEMESTVETISRFLLASCKPNSWSTLLLVRLQCLRFCPPALRSKWKSWRSRFQKFTRNWTHTRTKSFCRECEINKVHNVTCAWAVDSSYISCSKQKWTTHYLRWFTMCRSCWLIDQKTFAAAWDIHKQESYRQGHRKFSIWDSKRVAKSCINSQLGRDIWFKISHHWKKYLRF